MGRTLRCVACAQALLQLHKPHRARVVPVHPGEDLEPRLQRGYDNRRKIFIAQDREDPPPMERLAGWVRLQLLWAAGSGQARGGRKWADGRLACMKCVDLVQESWSPSDRANARACTSSSRGTMRSTMP